MKDIQIKCTCGSVRGVIQNIPHSLGKRAVCFCDDCQAYAHHLGRAKQNLDANGGSDICPVTPCHLKITAGQEKVKCLRLSSKGMYRWYAGCCKSPIANLMPSSKFPFAGIPLTIMDFASLGKNQDEILGPVYARIMGKYGIPPLPKETSQRAPLKFLFATAKFLLPAWVKGEYAPSPFFDAETGKPKVEPYILKSVEREHLRKFCGPKPLC